MARRRGEKCPACGRQMLLPLSYVHEHTVTGPLGTLTLTIPAAPLWECGDPACGTVCEDGHALRKIVADLVLRVSAAHGLVTLPGKSE